MLLGGIEIPTEVLTAWEAGELVIFTGAGISVGAPSNLPTFEGLAKQIAETLKSPLDPTSAEWMTQLDAFMDVLNEGEGADVHRHVQRIISNEASLPNPSHQALARVAARGRSRIVTTNYDLHLQTSLECIDAGFEVFKAPALPLGDAFDGLVYLHGSVRGDHRELVVTDRDFSRAYFHHAWAARFLERMFSQYVVLFIGYSHTDVVTKYLGLGLGAQTRRYVITDTPDDPLWKRLRVTTLPYPNKDYATLTRCLTEWADYGELGLLGHRERIRSLVSGPSQQTPDEGSYLEDSIQRTDRVGFFCDYAKDKFWLEWAKQHEPFQKLFDRGHDADEVTARFARWFADDFALTAHGDEQPKESANTAAWKAFAEHGGVLSTPTWNAIGQGLHSYTGARPPEVLRWLWVLMEQEHAGCWTDVLDYAYATSEVWEDQELALALMAFLMSPRLVPDTWWDGARLRVETRGDEHWLTETWNKQVAPNLDHLAARVFGIAEGALDRHLNLEAGLAQGRFGFSARRPAIQAHKQNDHRNSFGIVIDAVRDSAVALASAEPGFATATIERWLESEHELKRRLAVHLLGFDQTMDATARVRFVLDRGLADDGRLAQEVFHLLTKAVPEADASAVEELIDAYAPTGEDPRDLQSSLTAWESFAQSGVTHQKLDESLTTVREQLKAATGVDVKGDPYPGMRSWSEVGGVPDRPPLTAEEFDARVIASPEDAVEFVLGFEERTFTRSEGGPTREDALTMLRATVRTRPAAGLELWPHIGTHLQLQGCIVAAWGDAVDHDDTEQIMTVLANADLAALLHDVAQFLMHAARSSGAHWEDASAFDLFISRMWDACATEQVFDRNAQDDWISLTINRPGGVLWDFWFEMFRRRWAAAGDSWSGLPPHDKDLLEMALADRTQRGAFALTQCAGRIHFLDSADSDWCRTNLLPLRDWGTPEGAAPFWWGVLSFARWNTGLLKAGLLDGLIETARHLDEFRSDQANRWALLMASISTLCEDPPAAQWVGELTAVASEAQRVMWLDSLGREFSELDEAPREAVWTGWLAPYWKSRISGNPRNLTRAEAGELAALAPKVPTARFPEAVELVVAAEAGLDSHAGASRPITDALMDAWPEEVGRFLTHLMENTHGDFWGGYDLQPKLQYLVGKPGDWDRVRNASLKLKLTV
jgi:hypothetical protein